jgi:Ca2+-binding EF-hand superfamily protein
VLFYVVILVGAKHYWHQVGSAIRSFGWQPTNAQWQHVLNGSGINPETEQKIMPTKEDLARKQVSFEEFLPVMAEVSKLPPTGNKEDYLEGLKVFDKEGNGYVNVVEIQHVLGTLGEALDQDEVKEIFDGIEINSQGNMKFSSFVAHFMADPADE